MKKHLKLLLLGGIFTLIGIFNFSNASYDINNIVNVNAGGSYSIPSGVSSFTCDSSAGSVFLSYIVHDSFFGDMNNGQYMNCPFIFKVSSNYRNVLVQNNSSSSIKLSYLSITDTLEFNQLLVLFTPVIDLIPSVFVEFIPYFVYLSIGILIVTLGFYAVRWLVNWLNKKINNTFK